MPVSSRTYILDNDDKLIRVGREAYGDAMFSQKGIKGLSGGRYRLIELSLDMLSASRPAKILSYHSKYVYLNDDGTFDSWVLMLNLPTFFRSPIDNCKPSEALLEQIRSVGLQPSEATLNGERVEISPDIHKKLFEWSPSTEELQIINQRLFKSPDANRAEIEPDKNLVSVHGPYVEALGDDKGSYRDANGKAISGIFTRQTEDHKATIYIDSGYTVKAFTYPDLMHGFKSEVNSYWNQLLYHRTGFGEHLFWHYGPTGALLPGGDTLNIYSEAIRRVKERRVPGAMIPLEGHRARRYEPVDTGEDLSIEAQCEAAGVSSKIFDGRENILLLTVPGKIAQFIDIDKLREALHLFDDNMARRFSYYVPMGRSIDEECKSYLKAEYKDLAFRGKTEAGVRINKMVLFGLPPEHLFSGIF